MTPRYRAKAKLLIGRLIYPGEEFTSDLPPGRNWEPLNDEAKARKGAVTVSAAFERIEPSITAPGAVAIPDNWRTLPWPKKRALALQFGGTGTINKDDAESLIEAELERRAQKAAA